MSMLVFFAEASPSQAGQGPASGPWLDWTLSTLSHCTNSLLVHCWVSLDAFILSNISVLVASESIMECYCGHNTCPHCNLPYL